MVGIIIITSKYLRLFFALFVTKLHSLSLTLTLTGSFEVSETKVTNAVDLRERRVSNDGLSCVDKLSGSDSSSGEHASPGRLGEQDPDRRGPGSTRVIILVSCASVGGERCEN